MKSNYLTKLSLMLFVSMFALTGCFCDEEEVPEPEPVVLDRVQFEGIYSTAEECRVGPNDNYDITISPGSSSDDAVIIVNLYNQNEQLEGVVVGNVISIPEQVTKEISYFATGELKDSVIELDFSVASGGQTDRCTAICTKK